MTSRESRRAQINDIFQSFDDDISRLTRINEVKKTDPKQKTQLELTEARVTIKNLEEQVKCLTRENEGLRRDVETENFGQNLEEINRLKAENGSLREQIEQLKQQYEADISQDSIFCDLEYSNETRESHDSGIQFTEVPSDCDSTSVISRNPLDSLLCNEDINRQMDFYFDNETLAAPENVNYFMRTPTKNSPVKFRTPQKKFRTPPKSSPCSSVGSASSTRSLKSTMQRILMDSELPNITTRPLVTQITDRPGRTFQLSSSGLSTLRRVASPTSLQVCRSHVTPKKAQPRIELNPKSSPFTTEDKLQSPRKLKTVNILRRKRANEKRKAYDTPTRSSRRKQVL